MTPDKKSIFREIAKGLPPAQQTEFWEMAAHLEKLSPDDEILRVCQAMGVLTLITQRIPVELAVQREAWQETCTAFRNELRAMLQKAQEQSTVMTNQVAGLAQEVNATGQLVVRSAEKVEKALRHGADGFATEKLALDVRAKMEATILKPAEETVKKSAEVVRRLDEGTPRFEKMLERVENYNSACRMAYGLYRLCGRVANFRWLCLVKTGDVVSRFPGGRGTTNRCPHSQQRSRGQGPERFGQADRRLSEGRQIHSCSPGCQ